MGFVLTALSRVISATPSRAPEALAPKARAIGPTVVLAVDEVGTLRRIPTFGKTGREIAISRQKQRPVKAGVRIGGLRVAEIIGSANQRMCDQRQPGLQIGAGLDFHGRPG